MGTFMANAQTIERKWYVIDAAGKALGRVAAEAAVLLRGKHKVDFTPHADCGDFVVIINSDQIILTGDKANKKKYYHYSGYPGGLKEIKYGHLMESNSPFAVQTAVKGMLPHNSLGRSAARRLFVYKDANHKHQAQQPAVWEMK